MEMLKYADAKNKKYPIDNEQHIRAAWNYIQKQTNRTGYSSAELKTIESNIISAWKKTIDKDGPPSAQKELDEKDMILLSDEQQNLGPVSFAELEAEQAAEKMAGDVDYLTAQFKSIVGHICDGLLIADRIPAIQDLVKEYETRLNAIPTETKALKKPLPPYPPSVKLAIEGAKKKIVEVIKRTVNPPKKHPSVSPPPRERNWVRFFF